MDFGTMVAALRAGSPVRRAKWEAGRRVVYVPARLALAARPPLSQIVPAETWLWSPPHLASLSPFQADAVSDSVLRYVAWRPSTADVVAEDWTVSDG